MRTLLVFILSCIVAQAADTYYIAPSGGNDSGPGTYADPWGNIETSAGKLSPGDTLVFKNGTYTGRMNILNLHGSSGSPITFQAETERQVTLQAGVAVSFAHVNFRNCSWIVFEGFRVVDPRPAGSNGLHLMGLDGTSHSVVRRNVFRQTSNTQHLLKILRWIATSNTPSNNIVEENVALGFHRHAFSAFGSARNNTFRRNYADTLGGHLLSGAGPEGVNAYGASGNLYEDNILIDCGVNIAGTGLAQESPTVIGGGGPNNTLHGIITIGKGITVNARVATEWGYVTNNIVANSVILNATTAPGYGGYGMHHWHGANNVFSNCVAASGVSHGFHSATEKFFYYRQTFYEGEWYDVSRSSPSDWDLQDINHSVTFTNCVSVGNAYGFLTEHQPQERVWIKYPKDDPFATVVWIEDPVPTNEYLGVQTTVRHNVIAYGNTIANYSTTTIGGSHGVVNSAGTSTANPGYDTTKYGDGAYLMPAPNNPALGASIIYRTIDGVRTTTPLWPWPTDDLLMAEEGITATYEATGGLWKTLDGVYDTSTPTDPTVSLSLPDGNSVFEGGDTITVRISRLLEGVATTSGNLSGTWTIGGTAVNGTHYNTVNTNWQIDDGQSTEDIVITTTPNDGGVTGDLTITLTLDPSANYTVQGGSVTINWRDITFDGTLPRNPPLPGSYRPPPL